MRVSPRVLVAVLAPAIVALAVGLPLLWRSMIDIVERTAADDLDATLSVIVPLVREQLDAGIEIDEWAQGLIRDRSLRLTVIGGDGSVLADSWGRDGDQVDSVAAAPEVVEARSSGRGVGVRRSATLDATYVFVAQALSRGDGDVVVVRLGKSLSTLRNLRQRMAGLLWTVVLVSLATLALVAAWLNLRFFGPLEQLVTGADRIARGELDHRLEVDGEESLERVGSALNRLARRIDEQIAVAEAERSHLQVVGASMSEGVLVTDQAGRAVTANPSFRKLFRVKGEVAGMSALELTHRPEIEDMIAGTLESGETRSAELEVREPAQRWVAVTSSMLRDASGAVVAARDISALVQMGRVRRDLVANVSHELKTPLAAIRGYAETLQEGAGVEPEVRERFLDRILQQCRRLQALLDDLLTLSRLESAHQTLELEPVEIETVLRDTIEVLGAVAREKDVLVSLAVEEGLVVEGNRVALDELCLNLVENAIKYNRVGGRVEVVAKRAGDALELEIKDTGRGIPIDAQPRLFERFYRVDRGRARNEGGTGLGLAIVKHSVNLHGGEIEVSSLLGEGSIFTVTLPLRRDEPAAAAIV